MGEKPDLISRDSKKDASFCMAYHQHFRTKPHFVMENNKTYISIKPCCCIILDLFKTKETFIHV